MKRREFIKVLGAGSALLGPPFAFTQESPGAGSVFPDSTAEFGNRANVALDYARKLGASYADLRLCRYVNEGIATREQKVESISSSENSGFGVRVLVRGVWGFAGSSMLTPEALLKAVRKAVEIARAGSVLQLKPVELESTPAHRGAWTMKMKRDPFSVSIEEKIGLLLKINDEAVRSGADFCQSSMVFVREEKYFASSRGSMLRQRRVRSFPRFVLSVVDKKNGRFESRTSFAAPRGSGYEYVETHDFLNEARQAAAEVREKLSAPGVVGGVKDLLIHPTNLWLTIHETVGHPTELDRAFGYEANFAGTSFATPDQLGVLRYGSPLVNIVGDRTQTGGLATVGYDDDGVQTKGAEFHIVKEGVFSNYQMSIGQAGLVRKDRSNGCAFADNWDKMPMQRMPNISLQPGKNRMSAEDLASDIKDGIYIVGDGSWSIDQQRKNFQFTGQLFYEIKNGKIGRMLRDVGYQGNSVDFWNSCDGLAGREHYFLGGAFNCGKGQPMQIAPVSHGAVPARFRRVNVLNTGAS